jgi:RNA polymerase sigma-70 factor (ECF subfamily)
MLSGAKETFFATIPRPFRDDPSQSGPHLTTFTFEGPLVLCPRFPPISFRFLISFDFRPRFPFYSAGRIMYSQARTNRLQIKPMHDLRTQEADGEFNPLGDLMRRAQDGDTAAYADLLNAVLKPIRAFLQRHYPGIRDTEDVVQESLITLHKIRHTYEPMRPFTPWLFAIVRHRALDHLRKHGRIQSREVQEELRMNQAPAPVADDLGESVEAAEQLLSVLSEKEQAVIRLMKIEYLSVKDVAARLKLSESNVKVIASRGYEKLRKAWSERHANQH